MKKALITGITGPRYAPSSLPKYNPLLGKRGRQDGSYLAEFLIKKVYPVESCRYSTGGYEVHGTIRFIP